MLAINVPRLQRRKRPGGQLLVLGMLALGFMFCGCQREDSAAGTSAAADSAVEQVQEELRREIVDYRDKTKQIRESLGEDIPHDAAELETRIGEAEKQVHVLEEKLAIAEEDLVDTEKSIESYKSRMKTP